jgi:Kef-type K+ transport system membrane component KefB
MNVYAIAAIWMALALAASIISIRIGIAVALAEILVGAVAGNIPGVSGLVQQTAFTTFLASLGSVTLTFLAGAEIDPVSLRRHWKASLSIGLISFALPFFGAMAVCYYGLRWDLRAVVYAVMVETGLNREDLGKLILAACFVTDLGTVLALGALFAGFNLLLVVFAVATAIALFLRSRRVCGGSRGTSDTASANRRSNSCSLCSSGSAASRPLPAARRCCPHTWSAL